MDVAEDSAGQKRWMLDLLINHYGVRGHDICREDQPNVIDLPQAEAPQKPLRKSGAKTLKAN